MNWSTSLLSGGLPCTGIASHRQPLPPPAQPGRRGKPPVFPYTPPTGLRSHTEMIDQITNLEDGDIALPTASLDLSTRMRDLRARQGLKQSEVARRMRLDPSIPSLWEQGKRLVPANRVRALADALEVNVEELLAGVSGAHRPEDKSLGDELQVASVADLIDERAVRPIPADDAPLLRLVPQT